MKNIKAFTLAEALLTLIIIGVVAAMTIPAVKNHTDEAKFVSGAKKAYTNAQQATSSIESKYGDCTLWPWGDAGEIRKRYEEVMQTVPTSVKYEVKTMDGAKWADISNANWFQTTDGMLWYPVYWNNDGGRNILYVDTNGNSDPNIVGVDVHAFLVDKDGVFPLNARKYYSNSYWACTNYTIIKGQMPWLKDSSYKNCEDPRIKNF